MVCVPLSFCVCVTDRVLWGESLERSKQTSVHSEGMQRPSWESVGSLWNWFLIIKMQTISSDRISEGTHDWRCLLRQKNIMNKHRWNFLKCANKQVELVVSQITQVSKCFKIFMRRLVNIDEFLCIGIFYKLMSIWCHCIIYCISVEFLIQVQALRVAWAHL